MIIVTGGAGFIGSVLVWYLNQQGIDDILIVDSLKTGEKWKNLVGLSYSEYIEKESFLEQLTMGQLDDYSIEAIFHLGACSSTTEQDASYLVRNNYQFSKTLAQFADMHHIRFIYASSAATYGNGTNGYNDDESELAQLRPLNMYGYSKHMFDLWAFKNGLLKRFVGLKYFNVFGPNEYHKGDMKSLICKAVPQIQETGSLKLFKSYKSQYEHGGQKRDFVYVKDVVKMTAFFYLENQTAAGIFNVGSGKANSWNQLAAAVFSGMGVDMDINYIEMPNRLKETYQYFTQANMKKIRKAGYTSDLIPFEDAVVDYVQNYILHHQYITESE